MKNKKRYIINKRKGVVIMVQMTMEELEQKLKQWENMTINLVLEGLIATVIRIENAKVTCTQDEITIYNKNNQDKKVILNTHQIMKIEKQNDVCFSIKFDALQNVTFIQLP